ncbi:MAG: hypothetical protein KIT31_43680, partial [Deltaproteobacteria bacterium]|nr:hypothetical protein [Deltaproteobacteria bacterium]
MRPTLRLATAIVFVVILGASSRAEAGKRIPIVFQSGSTMFESGPLPPPYDKDAALIGATAGYVCNVNGVFWSYITIEDCEPAAIRGNTFDTSADLAAAVRAAYPEPTIPFWAEHGWKLMAGGVVFVIVMCILLGLRRSDDEEADEAGTSLVRDGRGGDRPRTKFHMAVQPALAKDRTAAFEGSSAVPSAPVDQPKFVEQFQRGSSPVIAPYAAPMGPAMDMAPYAAPVQPSPMSAYAAPVQASPMSTYAAPVQASPAASPDLAAPVQPSPMSAHASPSPSPMNAAPVGPQSPITGFEPTSPLRPEPESVPVARAPRARTDVVPPPIARPNALVVAPHLAQPVAQAPAQPMRSGPPSMPPAVAGMPQPQYAHVQQPVAPTVAIRPSQHPVRDINDYLTRPSSHVTTPPPPPEQIVVGISHPHPHTHAQPASLPMPQPLPKTAAVPMPERARPSVHPLASVRAAAAQPQPVVARPVPALPTVPPLPSGPPEMPSPVGYPQPGTVAATTERVEQAPALPVERRFDQARLAPSSPIALVPGVQQYARTPGQSPRPAAH